MSAKESKKEWYEAVGFILTIIEDSDCRAFHKKGQQFLINDYTTPAGLCFEVAHGIYPLLFAMRLGADMQELGSEDKNSRIWTCPSKVIKFQVEKFHQCNNCGKRVQESELSPAKKKFGEIEWPVKVCPDCVKILSTS